MKLNQFKIKLDVRPEINSNFQTSGLENSPTEEIGSVNFLSDDENEVGGFNTQFMDYPNTLYRQKV